MIEALVDFSLRRPRLVLLLTLLFVLVGGYGASRLRFDALPDVTGQQVLVLTGAPGFSPEEVERLVTRPVEMALGGLPQSTGQRSISRAGISAVTVLFEDDTELLKARQLVQERLFGVAGDLPEGASAPELGPLSGGLGEVYQFTLNAPERTTTELSELVKYRISPLLRSVPGVVEVNTWGGRERTLDVVVEPGRLAQRRVTLAEVGRAVEAATGHAPGALLEVGQSGLLLRGVAWPRLPEELAQAVVRVEPDGSSLRLGDVALVREGARPRLGAATLDGRGETVFVMVQMLLGDNALEVSGRIQERMEEVRRILPDDVQVAEVYDRSELVFATLRTVAKNLAEGGLLVVLVLFLALGSFRAGLLVALVIPLSLLGALLCMALTDVPGNLMSLGALDFGLLVDGGVVLVEAVFFALHDRGGEVKSRVRETAVRMARPVFFSVLMILLVYLPVLSLTGVAGKMFRPMALAVVFALGSALVLSLTFVPAALLLFLRRRDVPDKEPLFVRAAQGAYGWILPRVLARPRAVLASGLGLLGLGLLLFSRSGVAFVPQLDEGDWVLQTVRSPDIRIEAAVQDNLALERALVERVPEVRHAISRIGSPAVATDIMGLEQADVFLDLAPREAWRPGLTRAALLAEMEQIVQEASPVDELVFTQPIQMRFNELIGGSVSDVTLSIFGADLEELGRLERRAAALLERLPGAVDVRPAAPPPVRQLEVIPSSLALGRQGLTSRELLDHVVALRAGAVRGLTYDDQVRLPIQLRLGGDVDASNLERLPIPTATGSLVALETVAEVRRSETPSLVSHENAERRGVVGFNVRDRDLGSVVEEARAKLQAELPLPPGYRFVFGGQYQSLEVARARLQIVVPLVLILLLGLLIVLFRALQPAIVILLNVPFAAVGGLVALALAGLPLSISAVIGFIALSGIAVLNGVVWMNTLLEELSEGRPIAQAARLAAEMRLRPVLMTALVAGLGFVPMMLASGAGAEVQRPLATVVVGGLFTSTWLTLILLPTWTPRWLRRFTPPGLAIPDPPEA